MTGAGEFPVNLADVAVVAILLLSGLLAYSRGLVREVLAVAVWVGAGLAALYGFAHVRPLVHEYVPTPWLADIGAGAGLFVVAFLLFTVISRPVVRRVRDSAFRTADRSLGFLFGVVRGAVVVCLVFLLMSWLFPAGQQPEWITTASSRPYVEKGAQLLKLLVPAEAQEAGASAAEATEEGVRKEIEERLVEQLTRPLAKDAAPDDPSGYNKAERRDMERLIQSNQ